MTVCWKCQQVVTAQGGIEEIQRLTAERDALRDENARLKEEYEAQKNTAELFEMQVATVSKERDYLAARLAMFEEGKPSKDEFEFFLIRTLPGSTVSTKQWKMYESVIEYVKRIASISEKEREENG